MVAAAPPFTPDFDSVLAQLTEDAFFTIAGSARIDLDALRALAQKRAPAREAAARGTPVPGLDAWDTWVLELCAHLASIAPPRWMPLADAVEAGLSLSHGARGLRSLFSSKPSDKDVARVRGLGGAALRSITSVLAATGPLSAEAILLRNALLVSLGLPDADRQALWVEEPLHAEMLDLHGDLLEDKLAKSIVRSAFYVARIDGTDPREEQAAITIARKLGRTTEQTNEAREEARAMIDAGKAFGDAAVDAVRYLLEGDPQTSDRFAVAAARLALTALQRHDAITAINVQSPVLLGRRHRLDRKQREAALALAWLAAVSGNPTYIRRATLVTRHDKLAADLGDESEGAEIRGVLDRFLEVEIGATAKAVSG
jgi:hypothetical protein